MSTANSSVKGNAYVESKNGNESIIQDESQNLIDSLFNIRKYHSNKIIMAHININSLGINLICS